MADNHFLIRPARWLQYSLFLLMFTLSVGGSAAAQTSIPLVIHIDGQLYRWSQGENEPQFTGCDLQGNRLRYRNYSLVLSPTGEWAAFMVLPEDITDGAPTPTGNLWVCNVNTGEAYALTDRSPTVPGVVSEGAFSGDGSRIIWAEINDQDPTQQTAVVYLHDLATKESRVLIDSVLLVGYCGAGLSAPRLLWGEVGIVVDHEVPNLDNGCERPNESAFSLYADDGTMLNSFSVGLTDDSNFVWLARQPTRIVYRGTGEQQAQLFSIDLLTGEIREEAGTLQAFTAEGDAAASVTSLVVGILDTTPLQIKLPSSQVVLETATDVALSPDGTFAAILLGRTLYFAENGLLTPAPWNQQYFPISDEDGALNVPDYRVGQFEVAWVNPHYRIVPQQDSICPSVEQLYLNNGAYVVEGLGDNNVRPVPLRTAESIGTLAEGEFVSVIDAYNFSSFQLPPVEVCTEGIRWREILFEGHPAWTAEAQGDTYFLESR